MPDMLDIITIDGDTDLTAAQFLNRDCSFPIMKLQETLRQDEVLAQMPIYFAYWNDGKTLPVILDQTIDVDTSVQVDDCDSAVVTGDITQGELIAPDMKKIKLKTKPLQIDKLIPVFCKGRNITEGQRKSLINPDGSINEGNPYAVDFARFVFSLLKRPFVSILGEQALNGDASEEFGIDGLYNQLENGWTQGSPTVPTYLNQAIQIDWADLVGLGSGSGTPDDLTVTGKTISLWGESLAVPEDYNLAMFLEDFLFPAIEAHWGSVDNYEIHVESGKSRCFVRSAACIRPCNADEGIWDTDLRERYANLAKRNVVQLYPSGKELAMLESPKVGDDTMWIGPRSVDGNPTYALFFRDMDEMYSAIGTLGDVYGQRDGIPMDEEPLLTDIVPTINIPFEGRAIRQDLTKLSIDCVEAGVMSIYGVLAFARHMWIKVENITCATYVKKLASGVTIDGTAIETHV